MAKSKRTRRKKVEGEVVPLYVELPVDLDRDFREIAERNMRTIKAEIMIALRQYVERTKDQK